MPSAEGRKAAGARYFFHGGVGGSIQSLKEPTRCSLASRIPVKWGLHAKAGSNTGAPAGTWTHRSRPPDAVSWLTSSQGASSGLQETQSFCRFPNLPNPTSCPLDCSQAVTQRALAQVPVRDCSSVPLSSPDCPCSFCSSLGGCRDCGGATPSPGAPAVPSVAGPHPRAGPGGEAGSLPVNHRPQPLLILSLPAGSFSNALALPTLRLLASRICGLGLS